VSTTLNILIVDDKIENLVALEELLRQPNRQLVRATSGNDALRLLLKHDFALVLLDVEMPGMDGYETAQLMRSVERTKSVPIIFVTAGDRSEERTFRGYEAGAVDFLYKPINAHSLKSKVDVFLDLHDKARELQRVNTDLERTSAALRAKIEDLENVSQTLSHDLRAPLRSIQGFAAALAEDLHGKLDPGAASYLDRIRRSSERMAEMLNDLFALLRLSAAETVHAEVDANTLVAEVVDRLRADLDQAGVAIRHGALPTLRTNRFLLGQILQNLISNAIKFRGGDDPTIEVSAESVEGAWRFAVKDNGIGIAPVYAERIFRLFERLDTNGAGSGVGLTLCKRAVEKLGGSIWVMSTLGDGATFYFTLGQPHA
jgi:signal transduction histidine kinase